eukprot:s896_g19.t1
MLIAHRPTIRCHCGKIDDEIHYNGITALNSVLYTGDSQHGLPWDQTQRSSSAWKTAEASEAAAFCFCHVWFHEVATAMNL